MDFLGQLVWSLILAVGTSSLCHNVHWRLPDYWINLGGDINALEPRALCNTLRMGIDGWTDNLTFPEAWENGGCIGCIELKTLLCIWNMSHRMKTLLTRPPVPCLTLIVSCKLVSALQNSKNRSETNLMNGKRIHQKFSYRVSYAVLYPQRNFLLRSRKT